MVGRTTLLRASLVVLATWAGPTTNCGWNVSHSPRCDDPLYRGPYPTCALFQQPDLSPIPCRGMVEDDYCATARSPPPAASWHVHVFFPNVNCTNCSDAFTEESANFTYAGAMRLRGALAEFLNEETARITGRPPDDPIDATRARRDPRYSPCIDTYQLVAGAPANYHDEPCIYEVDAVKELGPFTDPGTGLGYPNWSFLIPSDFWTPGLKNRTVSWFNALPTDFRRYDVLFHPNTGCEARDHVDATSPDITWLGTRRALDAAIFSCNALGCNQACPSPGARPPADCGAGDAPS